MSIALRRYLPLVAAVLPLAAVEEHQGWLGDWVEVVATAYSPVDPIDSAYHATKGERWRWITADGRTDVREDPYGVAVPLSGRRPRWAFGTKLLIPVETGYLARTRPDDRVFEVDDVGNGKEYYPTKGGKLHIDLRFKSHASAIAWAGPAGYRTIKVFKIQGPAPVRPPPVVGPTIEELFGPLPPPVEIPEPPPSIPEPPFHGDDPVVVMAEAEARFSWMLFWVWSGVTFAVIFGLWLWWWLDKPKSLPK
ncbi:MAG: hypothetical protein BWY85_00064 [Firmicutes bacterium ADurb.Bin506]|nr:MAG: hypothetical protein BWY85_00064 [Firmicutes bacterium ADurb.Bin506]